MAKKTSFHVVWLRNDLRSYDNAALYNAAAAAHAEPESAVIALFIATPETWQQHHMAPLKQDFIRRRVAQMQKELNDQNIALLALEAGNYEDCMNIFRQLTDAGMIALYGQTEYELREQHRDKIISQQLQDAGVTVNWYDRLCIMPPGSILTQNGDTYKVFTPFKRNWLARLHEQEVRCFPKAKSTMLFNVHDLAGHLSFPAMIDGDDSSVKWPVAEQQVLEIMREFCQQHVADYNNDRDFPAVKGTSGLSAYLACGVLSAHQCVNRLQMEARPALEQEKSGASVWLSELIWREFYKHILVAYPALIKHKPFQADTAAIRWRNNKKLFEAWCEGKTGYPIVDAAMRQLNQTGWMHNRLRMITASFLVKDLQIDWRWGEQYFMSKLIDGEFAANNGGWQWAASTGTDAAPYFRIFNPVTQSERFDPQGKFIRQFMPELAQSDNKEIHWPHKKSTPSNYWPAIVDHNEARKITLALFTEVKKSDE
ncbi:deoxyribodipyrimidine photo-lyase type I [Arsukibacterium tuosuense]|uniref:Deoxyribodipyrimidine photo-lyase n=1 Tax=Arsukibacterium tuosuense TaxID=1323745 RepID=A0A285ISC6_9GAMM|nr:deoxyribodipyrimidine photo-lyase [Arsukibacterium tuosuense]SNY50733.1 deoxyribodipyrimidine photo-lyase type I [Arsukibacterium tuosuense]